MATVDYRYFGVRRNARGSARVQHDGGVLVVKPLQFYVWENITRCMQRVAQQIWDEQVAAIAAGHRYSEETITERVAVLLSQAVQDESGAYVRAFNKREEGNRKTGNGADLAIWVQLPTGTYGFHFQAKSRVVGGTFRSFKPGGRQHAQLLDAAQREHANPAYLFYPAPDETAGAHQPAQDIRDFGCSATVAYSASGTLVPATANFASLSATWAPWHLFALATTWIGDGKTPAWWHPEVAAPFESPVRAAGLPTYLEDAVRRDLSYSEADAVAARLEGKKFVEKVPHVRNNLVTSGSVVSVPLGRARKGVRAVERVVQRGPASVRSVERVAGV